MAKQFLRYLADKVKMLNSSKGHTELKQEYIWFMGGDLNGFQDIMHFIKRAGGTCPRGTWRSMSLNAACHKEQQYIWFIDGDLNSF